MDDMEHEARRSAHVSTGCQGTFNDGWSAGVAWERERQRLASRDDAPADDDDFVVMVIQCRSDGAPTWEALRAVLNTEAEEHGYQIRQRGEAREMRRSFASQVINETMDLARDLLDKPQRIARESEAE